jgi:predicted porin
MRRLAAATVVFLNTFVPVAVMAQEPASAQQTAALQQLLDEQRRRIEALEAQLAQLQQEVSEIRGPQFPGTPGQEHPPEEPFTHAYDGLPPADPDDEGPNVDVPRAINVDSYGSLRVLTAADTDGHWEVRNNSSRLGIRGEKPLFGDNVLAFGRYEMGVNMVANDRAILLISADPGTPIGQGSQAITSRLGFAGIKTPIGNVSWGKQWSPYYDVAEFSDQLQVFSGTANGAFGARTDGGIAGTGRAERAVQYREAWGPFAAGVQIQQRSLTINDRHWADTFGVSFIVGEQNGLAFGAAYNKVRDGVLTPTINEPQLGDEATIFGVRYRSGWSYAGTTYAILKQHEIDDLGRRFDGNGFELALRQHFTERLWIEGAYNDLHPDSDHPGDFRIRFGATNIVYNYNVASRLFFGFKLEKSRNSDRTRLTESTFAGGLNYTF